MWMTQMRQYTKTSKDDAAFGAGALDDGAGKKGCGSSGSSDEASNALTTRTNLLLQKGDQQRRPGSIHISWPSSCPIWDSVVS